MKNVHVKGRFRARGFRWMAFSAALMGILCQAGAASLKVSPARFIIHDVKPGIQYDVYKATGLRITLYNDDDVSHSWLLSVHRPSERGTWERGYAEIPDARWCWFDRNEVAVEPHGKAYAHLFLKVPENEKYYNQHWVVTMGVDGKPGAGGIALAADIRAQIETTSSPDMKERPGGLLGMVPSALQIENAAPGAIEKRQVSLYNNDTKAHTCAITSLFDDPAIDQKVYLTHPFEATPDPKWITVPKEISIAPGGVSALDVEIRLPDDPSLLGKQWESIFLIQPEEGRAGFVRVQVSMKETAKTE